jgi:mono/diheme cytochrome c family protein
MRRACGLGLPLLAMLALAAPQARAGDQSFEQIENGRYLATAGDCAACHTVPGEAAFAGGRAIETPFGSLIAPNITPDRETGIGAWTDDDFLKAMQEGVGPDGAHLYPAFPYPYFTKMTRDDILAIRRYLQTIEPIKNAVEANQLPFPFSIRASMIGWNMLFFDKGVFKPDPAKSADWNRGAYLVQGPGHCGACHTAKTCSAATRAPKPLRGGHCRAGSRPTLPATCERDSAAGRSRMSSPI